MEQSKTLKEYLEEEISSMQKRIDEVDKACKEYRTQLDANLGAKMVLEKMLKEKKRDLENIK
jgi:chromosome segregation ATPase